MARSTLWHWDLHASNLFVKDDQVTSIIDWQSNWAGPLFVQYRYPKIVDYAGEVAFRLPEDYESMEGNEKVKVSCQVERSLVQYLYEAKTKETNPLLTDIINIPQRTIRKQTISFAEDSWEGDILSFRQCLIRLERYILLCYQFKNLANVDHADIGMRWDMMPRALSILLRKIYRIMCGTLEDSTSRPIFGTD